MRKIFTPLFILCAVVILLSSCSKNSSLSLTKRHYRNGYFVEYANGKQNNAKKNSVKTNEPKTAESGNSHDKVNVLSRVENKKSDNDHNSIASENKKPTNSAQKALNTISSAKDKVSKMLPFMEVLTKDPVLDRVLSDKRFTQTPARHENRPWIWAIVILVFVLFYLGLKSSITGISWLLYFLLILAIILMIIHIAGMV